MQLPRAATNGLQYLDSIEGTKTVWVCREGGHRMVKDFGKGPRHQRTPAAAIQSRARYWGLPDAEGKRHGHVYGWCQKCQNQWDKEKR